MEATYIYFFRQFARPKSFDILGFHLFEIQPDKYETIAAVRQLPAYVKPFKAHIDSSRKEAVESNVTPTSGIQIYMDGLCIDERVGAAAVLYRGNTPPKNSMILSRSREGPLCL